jgi:ABC-type multidrug transport system ATPase subunit
VNGAAVRIRGLAKSFGPVRALDGVTLDVPERSIFGLVGPNGAGKTTLFSVVANFLRADAGGVEVLGVDVRRISGLRGRLAILPQDALFQRNVPIVEQLAFFRMLDGRKRGEAEADARRTLERVGLGPYVSRGVHALSHGMVKRLGLAQAFLGEPEVILLDEPTSGLDPLNARQIRDLVREFHARATILVSSHNLAEVQELCDHVAILDRGRLVASGPVAEVTRSGRRVEFLPPRPLTSDEQERLAALPGLKEVAAAPMAGRYVASLDPAFADGDAASAALLRALLDLGLAPRYFAEGNSLEEVFLRVTGKRDAG